MNRDDFKKMYNSERSVLQNTLDQVKAADEYEENQKKPLINNNSDGRDPPGTKYISRAKISDSNTSMPPNNNTSGKTEKRDKTPTKEDKELAKLQILADQKNIQIEKSGNSYKVFQKNTLIATIAGIGFLMIFLMALLFPKMNHDSQNAGASRKNKRSSRRNRK